MFEKRNLALAAAVLLASCAALTASGARADIVTLTMDEVSAQLDGLTVSKGGEDFTFSDPGGNLIYGTVISPGNVTYVQGLDIEGPVEPFSVSFSTPVDFIQFGLAESDTAPLTGASVTLSDGTVLSFDLPLADPFSEGQFTWSGDPVTGFTLTPIAGPLNVAFDNLTVDTVPEPSAMALLGAGLAGLGWLRRRKA